MRYCSISEAAPNIDDLLDQLRAEHRDEFLYRGQIKVYPSPLVPSAYRRYRRTGSTYTRDSAEFVHALRKGGNYYIGLVPVNYFYDTVALFESESTPLAGIDSEFLRTIAKVDPAVIFHPEVTSTSSVEIELLTKLSNDQYLARTLREGFEKAIETMLTPLQALIFHRRLPLWRQVIDYDHRVQIRDMVFMRPFGYLLGQALAQQYGFTSEMLDVTSDISVAAFFATHRAPAFLEVPTTGIGVIYRFMHALTPVSPLDLGAHNFYSCPPVLSMKALIEPFCTDEPCCGSRRDMEMFLVDSFENLRRWRRWEQFRIDRTLLDNTRVTRQHAAFIVPDLLYVEHGVTPNNVRSLMAVEDCSTREDTQAFYFNHTDNSRQAVDLSREYLWPNESDALFEMIGNALLTSVVLDSGQILPGRIDLLDPGYDPNT